MTTTQPDNERKPATGFPAKAAFRSKRTGQTWLLKESVTGSLYYLIRDYTGMYPWGASGDVTDTLLRSFSNEDEWQCVLSPRTPYHVWHVCWCPACAGHVNRDPKRERLGGRIWTHLQGHWNSHLKQVDPKFVFTFSSAKEQE